MILVVMDISLGERTIFTCLLVPQMERTGAVEQAVDFSGAESCVMSSLHAVAALVAQMTEDTDNLSLKQKEVPV